MKGSSWIRNLIKSRFSNNFERPVTILRNFNIIPGYIMFQKFIQRDRFFLSQNESRQYGAVTTFVKNEREFSRIIDFEISRNRPSIAYRRCHSSLSLFFFIPFLYDATTSKLRVCDTLYWLCYLLIRAQRDRRGWRLFFLRNGSCVLHGFHYPRGIFIFSARFRFIPFIFISVSFLFVCECRQIHSPAGNHFSWFDIPILPLVFSQLIVKTQYSNFKNFND